MAKVSTRSLNSSSSSSSTSEIYKPYKGINAALITRMGMPQTQAAQTRSIFSTPTKPPAGRAITDLNRTPHSINGAKFSESKYDASNSIDRNSKDCREINSTNDLRSYMTQSEMHKIKALKNECLHKIGIELVSRFDRDLDILERSLAEEDNRINKIK